MNHAEKDIAWGQADTLIGSVFTSIVAIFIIVVTGTVLVVGQDIEDAAKAAIALMPTNPTVGTFMAIGLADAGFLGAICISLSSSWAFGEVFGWAHSLNYKIKQAPWFYASYLVGLVSAGLVVLIPNAPLVLITLFVQVVAVTLLPAALVFLILLLNDKETMGAHSQPRNDGNKVLIPYRVEIMMITATMPPLIQLRNAVLARAIRSAIAKNVQTIHNINRRYATPRIKMSRPVRAALLTLRIYLLVLVALLAYKFYTILAQ